MYPQAMGRIHLPPGQGLPGKDEFGKPEYSKPHRPMTLPEIKGALNPNAPEFQLSAAPPMMNGFDRNGGPPIPGMIGGVMPHDVQTLNAMVMGAAAAQDGVSMPSNPAIAPIGQGRQLQFFLYTGLKPQNHIVRKRISFKISF